MVDAEHITQTVHRYLELVGGGSADDIADLFAGDATVEDPVGGEVHIGRGAIHRFLQEHRKRASGYRIAGAAGGRAPGGIHVRHHRGQREQRIRIEPIDVMVFNSDGRIASMKAYWSPADMAPA